MNIDVREFVKPTSRFEVLCEDIDSLEFCWNVYNDFADGKRKADRHMDMIKAQEQLLSAIKRVLKRGMSRG